MLSRLFAICSLVSRPAVAADTFRQPDGGTPMKPLAFALLVIALHLGVAAMAASRNRLSMPASFALVTTDRAR